MSTAREQPPTEPRGPAYASSILALALGVVLAVGVSAVFGLLGWGGELASQTAGAASGAAPLILDGIRQRRARARSRPSLVALSRGALRRYNKLWVASAFGFGLLLVDSAAGLGTWRLGRFLVAQTAGDPGRTWLVVAVLGAVITLPAVFLSAYFFAVAAAHRIGPHARRWILLGMGIYAAVRVVMVLLSGDPSPELNMTKGNVVGGLILTIPLMTGIALLGARRARKTQAAFYAQLYFRRLSAPDQEAALVLLDESVTAGAPSPPAAAAGNVVGPTTRGGSRKADLP